MKRSRKKSAVAKTVVKKEIIEILSDTDTDTDIGTGEVLALCEVNALGDDTLAKNPKKFVVAKSIVKNEIIEIESGTDEIGGRMLALCGTENASGDGTLAEKPENTFVAKTIMEKEIIEIESDTDTDEVSGRMLDLCGSENALGDGILAKDGKNKRTSMQIVSTDDCNSGLVHDLEYKKYLARFSETANIYLLEYNVRDSNPMRLDHEAVEASDKSKGRAVKPTKTRAGKKDNLPMISSVSKRLKTENGRADHNSVSRTVLRIKETKKQVSVAKNAFTQQKKGEVQRGRIISVAKKNVKLKPTSKATSPTIFRASKRLKTEIGRVDHNSISKTISVVNSKDTQRMKQKHNVESKIFVTKHNVESKSTSHVKDSSLHSFTPLIKENEDTIKSMQKSYAYFLDSLRYSITVFKSDQQVRPVKDFLSLSDPDIIAVSNQPFPDGDKSTFEATKDSNVIDLEDGIESDDIFNSSFSKKLIEILVKPYDEKEFLRLYDEASRKRPLTRSRQLRDGREIEYDVENQLTLSYLEIYTDFNTKYRHFRKDLPRALNLLRGLFFYLENIVLEGAFKPWMYEKRLTNMCFDATGCKYIARNK